MRLTEMRQDEWTKVAPYVDTLCLPVYRTAFSEKRIRLEERRVVEAVADRVERALTGRLLLLPAIAYEGGDREAFRAYLGSLMIGPLAFHPRDRRAGGSGGSKGPRRSRFIRSLPEMRRRRRRSRSGARRCGADCPPVAGSDAPPTRKAKRDPFSPFRRFS